MARKVYEYTFPETGITVSLRKVSVKLLAEARFTFTADGQLDHVRFVEFVLRRAIERIHDPEWAKAVKAYRKEMREFGLSTMTGSDMYIYITHIAAGGNLDEFMNFVTGKGDEAAGVRKIVPAGNGLPTTYHYEFSDSGITIVSRKVPPFLVIDARVEMSHDPKNPQPEPPKTLIEEEGPLQGTYEVNDADPDYIEALKKWESGIQERVAGLMLRRGGLEISDLEWRSDLAKLRKDLAEAGIDVPAGDDMADYIVYLASVGQNEADEYGTFLLSKTVPQPDQIQAVTDSFRPNA